jgi:hypothetical protein
MSGRCEAGQAVDAGPLSMAGLLRPDGYIVRVRRVTPFALSPLPVSRSGFSAGYWRSVLIAGRARRDAEQAEHV